MLGTSLERMASAGCGLYVIWEMSDNVRLTTCMQSKHKQQTKESTNSMSFWKKLLGKNSPAAKVAGTQSNKESSGEVEQIKKRLKSHPDYESLAKKASGGLVSSDEFADIVAKSILKNKKK